MHPYLDAPRPLVLAHRGFSAAHPENSMAAFAAAVELGCRYVETDVHATADGVLVAFHDATLDRVTDAQGTIAELTWAEVSRARVAGTEPVPRFEELLAAWPDLRVNVDIKASGAAVPLALAVERARAHDRVCVGAFNGTRRRGALRHLTRPVCTSASTERIAAVLAALRVGAPVGPLLRGVDCLQVPLRHRGVPVFSPALVRAAHGAGVQVHVWTLDTAAEMRAVLDAGADGIVTNRPDVALALAGHPTVLPVTESLRLRPFDPASADESLLTRLQAWYLDPTTVRLVDGPDASPYDRAKLMRMYTHLAGAGELYLVEELRGGAWEPVGDVTLCQDSIPIVLAPDARGRGLGRQVIAALVERARTLGWATVQVSDVYTDNEGSRRLFEGLGFVRGEATDHGHRYALDLGHPVSSERAEG